MISAVTVGPTGEIVVADSRIQVFSAKGDFMEVLYDEGKGLYHVFVSLHKHLLNPCCLDSSLKADEGCVCFLTFR